MATTANPTPDPTTRKPPRRRRWIPLSLWFIAVFLPVVGVVGFTWVSVRGYRNAVAIREIERLGGEVHTRPRGLEWLQERVRVYDERRELFDDVILVRLNSTSVTDVSLAHLTDLSSLEDLGLRGTRVTDAGLADLKGLKLRALWLDDTQVTDAGLAHLSGLTTLEFLSLKKTPVTDAGLAQLSGLTGLEVLDLDNTQVTDAGLAHLRGLTSLRELRLLDAPVTDAGIAELRRALPELIIDQDWEFIVGIWPGRRVHSPVFFASSGLLVIAAVTTCLLAIVFLLPLPAMLSAVGTMRHTDGMNAQARDPFTPESDRFRVRPARSLWFGQATAALIVVTVAFRFAVPIYRHQLAVEEIERLGGWFSNLARYPEDNTQATDVGLEQLDRLISLQTLRLSHSHVTDAGLVHLEGLTSLQALDLSNTQVTDAGLRHLKGLANLHELDLENTQVTDAGLAHLKALTRLEKLSLDKTGVTDAGLSHLGALTGLTSLSLEDTPVTDAGVADLQRVLPRLDIKR
jgi:hypothetical protein